MTVTVVDLAGDPLQVVDVSNPGVTPGVLVVSGPPGPIGATGPSPLINVMDSPYGAIGNGSTDDTTAIAAAYTAARAVQGTVYFPPGRTYIVSSALNPAGTVTQGYGAILKAKAGSTMFSMLRATTAGFSVYGLTIDMNKSNITDTGATQNGIACYVTLASGGFAGNFVDVKTINAWGAGIRIESNTTVQPGQYDAANAINTYGSVRNLIADNCQYGVFLYGTRNCRVIGCVITNSERGAIHDDNSFGSLISENNIDTCGVGVHDAQESGIVANYTRDTRIIGNHIQNCGFAGILIGGGSTLYTVAKEYVITGNSSRLNWFHGITLDTTVSGSSGVSQLANATVANNVCNDNGSSIGFGINAHNCDTVSIVGNTCINNITSGIRLDGRRLSCSGNTCIDNDQYGIELYGDAGTPDHGLYSMGINHCSSNGPSVTRNTYTTTFITDSPVILSGSGSPDGVYLAGLGSTYARRDGGAGTVYIKETGPSTASGWVPLRGNITPEQFGAVGNGSANDTTPVLNAFAAANALKVVSGAYADPGATVLLSKIYNLSSLAVPIDMMCNVQSTGATFLIPSGYTGMAVRIGHTTSGNVLRNATIEAPSIIGNTVAGPGSLPAGSIGVQIRNLYTSEVTIGNVLYFETGVKVGGQAHGVAYNRIRLRTISYCKVRLLMKPHDATGWVNQNTFIAGSITGDITWEGRRNTGSFGVLFDGVGSTTITGNTFLGVSFESDVYENVIEFRNAYMNQFYGCRHEQGIAAAALTVSGDTLTSTAHVLAVDDLVCFTGSGTPTGMSFDQPYYVVAVPTADTFKVSRDKSGTAITFSSAGSSVAYSRPQRVKYDKSWDNVIDLPMGPLKWLNRIETSAVPADTAGNLIRYPSRSTTDAYSPSEWPLHRARNRYTAGSSSQPLWASYLSTVNPDEHPTNWIAALTAKGFNFADGAGTELGWISNLAGVLKYQKITDSVVYELASCRRIQSLATQASGFTVNAQSTNSFTIALTGTAANDHVLVTPVAALPAGLILSHAYISATDTITVVLANITGSNITTGASMSFSAVVFRRFY